jgi:hypothetical protein
MSIEEWLLSNDDSNWVNCNRNLDPKRWLETIPLTSGEKWIQSLANRLQLNEGEAINGFWDYLNHKTVPENFVDLKNTLNMATIYLSEWRDFPRRTSCLLQERHPF